LINQQVDLVYLGKNKLETDWPLGKIWLTEPTPKALGSLMQVQLPESEAPSLFFWDAQLGAPPRKQVLALQSHPVHVWHAGLQLGMGGLPGLTDFVNPTWMLNRDPDATIEATSWRLSIRACLIQTSVLRQMGGIRTEFDSLAAATLEMGHRYITQGVIVRHTPDLLFQNPGITPPELSFSDELRFIRSRFGHFWSLWALGRAILSGYVPFYKGLRAWQVVAHQTIETNLTKTHYSQPPVSYEKINNASISVIIPTLNRYHFLRTLLDQLREQTIRPQEIIIIDQTPARQRDKYLLQDFSDLPLKILYRDQPGQCSARNAGLQVSCGEYILFIDDDDEVPPNLIETHLLNISRFQAQVSSGVAQEVGAGLLPENFTYTRLSDVFPANNTLIRREILNHSGLFDLAYEHGSRADGDLGIRIYLSGGLMILQPKISVVHHHAPQGGLRTHQARTITYASSRRTLTHRHLPSVTEIYLVRRYFTPRQLREMLWLRTVGTFSVRGKLATKILKFALGLLYLPHTIWQIRQRTLLAKQMLKDFPQIPTLTDD